MKRAITTSILLLWVVIASANEIDKLKTNKDVEQFLTKVDTVLKRYYGDEVDTITKFINTDIDNNGLTDIIIIGNRCFAVLDTGNEHYSVAPICAGNKTNNPFDVIYTKDAPLLVIKRQNDAAKVDTFIHKFGSFIEYNVHPDHLKVEEIYFATYDCYGCGYFELKIDATGWATYNDGGYESRKVYAGVIDLGKIEQTINYINLASLDSNIRDTMTVDAATFLLEVKFKNGNTKKIITQMFGGTSGLTNLCQQLFIVPKYLTEL